MYRIWFERPLPPAYASMLDGVAEAAGPASATPDNPLSALPGSDAIIASVRVRYDGALMDQFPTLRVISRTGIGLDNVSIPDATARRIAVCYTPDAPTISTAEHAIALMFAVAKRIKQGDRAAQAGTTAMFMSSGQGLELQGAQLGVVGLGRIGGHVAKVAGAIGMRVVGFDPLVTPERAAELGVERVPTLDVLLQTSDVVTLHVPLSPETRKLINADTLAQMKSGAILINAARGGLVDESALLAALERGHLRGAGLDVLEREPPPLDHPLVGRDDVVITPHCAGATGACQDRLWRTAITQALQVLRGERPPNLVNPEIWT